VLVSGTPSQLAALEDTLSTQPIDLSNHSSSFEVSVPVILPNSDLVLLSGQNITVDVEIKPVTTSRQFESIPIKVLGIESNSKLAVKIAPNTVSVLVNGPQQAVNQLTADDATTPCPSTFQSAKVKFQLKAYRFCPVKWIFKSSIQL
jgi:hypothetical protein